MTDDELAAVLRAHTSGRIGTHWETCHLDGNPRHHSGCAVGKLVAECRRLRAELAELRDQLAGQKAINLRLAERLMAQAECLARAAERDTVQGHTEGGR